MSYEDSIRRTHPDCAGRKKEHGVSSMGVWVIGMAAVAQALLESPSNAFKDVRAMLRESKQTKDTVDGNN